jgi:hypothetical protein
VLFVVGIVLTTLSAIPIAQQLQRDTTILREVSLATNKSASAQFKVIDSEKTLSSIVSARNPVSMTAVLIGPDGSMVYTRQFNETLTEGTMPTGGPGKYTLTVTNNGSRDTSVDIVLGYVPGIGQSNINVGIFGGVVAGAGITIAGIMAMIGGVIILVLDRRGKRVS